MVTLRSLDAGEVDTFQEHHQVGRTHLNSRAGLAGAGEAIAPGFEPLDVGITMPSLLVRYTIFARSV
jgi:hypothetical protein